jgi:hypothetical protein
MVKIKTISLSLLFVKKQSVQIHSCKKKLKGKGWIQMVVILDQNQHFIFIRWSTNEIELNKE